MMIYRYVALFLAYITGHLLLFGFLIPLMLQGTAVVVLAGLVASLKLLGWSLVEHTFLFFGAGEVSQDFLLKSQVFNRFGRRAMSNNM